MNELALFAGAGGGILGGKLLGWRTVCAVEVDEYARSVLMARQDDGCLPAFPIWSDVRSFDGRPWYGVVDIVTGGFPCQDISIAGLGLGLDGARSGLWREMRRIVGEVGPRYVLVENSPALTCRGIDQILADLAAMGYDARWGVLGAVDAGAPHKRDRIWILAHADSLRKLQPQRSEPEERGRPCDLGCEISDPDSLHEQRIVSCISDAEKRAEPRERSLGPQCNGLGWWLSEPDLGRVAHGVAYRVDRLRCLGNGQVPAVAALAWKLLSSKS